MIGEGSFSRQCCFCLLIVVSCAFASDVNWGKKVRCFVVDGTVVCPGCNYRAGQTCPRKLKDSQNCLVPSSTQPPKTTKTYPTGLPDMTTYEDVNATTEAIKLLATNLTLKTNEIQKEPTKSPIDMAIYLYRLLGSKLPERERRKRELMLFQQLKQQEEEEEEAEICNWNGDCPCPLICCKTGPGCPKRCVMGIRLPPPWG